MANNTLHVSRSQEDAGNIDYLVECDDGRKFELDFTTDIVECWKEQLSRAGMTVQLDEIAEHLADIIIGLKPSGEELAEGFLVTRENGFATPTAAEQTLKAPHGMRSFLNHHKVSAN